MLFSRIVETPHSADYYTGNQFIYRSIRINESHPATGLYFNSITLELSASGTQVR